MGVYRKPGKRANPFWFRFIEDGERHEGFGFATKKEAEIAEAQELLRIRTQKTGMAFKQVANKRLDTVQAYSTPHHYRTNITHLKRFSGWRDLDINHITTDMVRTKILELFNEGKGMSANNVNKHLRSLRSVFEPLVIEGLLGRNPCRGVKMLPVKKSVKFVPSPDQIAAVLLQAEALDRAYLTVIWRLGARVREVNNLPWEDVLWEKKLVRLWTRKKSGSNLTDRLVEMTGRCEGALSYAWQHRDKKSPYVWTNPLTGKPYDYRDKFFDRLCRLADVPEMGYHALRHARASELANENVPLQKIRDFLGHENVLTTSRYLHSIGVKVA